MYIFDRILCPTDFSNASLYATRYASFLAGTSNAHLKMLYVDEYEKDPLGFFERAGYKKSEYRRLATEFAQKKFDEAKQKLSVSEKSISTIVRFGTAYREIIDEAETNRYSAVVIATEGLGHASPHLLGRTVERVVRLCRTPVITVRPKDNGEQWKIKTILCPTDFSEYANYALPYAVSLARRHQAKIIMVHTVDLMIQHPELLIHKFPDLNVYHEHASEISVEKIVGRDVQPENTIVRLALEYDVDLVIMGTHGARGMRRVQIGNTTEEVVRRTDVPVLTVTHPIHKAIFPNRFVEDYENKKEE